MDKIRTGQYIIDEQVKQITYLDTRFYTADGENYFPSVTTILDAYPKGAAFYEWLKKMGDDADTVRDEAGERGSIVHQLTERYDNGEVVNLIDADGKIRYKSAEWKMFEKYVEFCRMVEPEILKNEFNIISPNLGTAGTIDRVISITGKNGKKFKYIMDIKTSNGVQPHYWLQLAAYKHLYEEAFPDDEINGVCILWLNAKTRGEKKGAIQGEGWQLIFPEQDVEHYWKTFQATQLLWNEVNGSLKPKNITYTLEHKK